MTPRNHDPESRHEISRLLIAWREGDAAAHDRLMPLVYGQLRRLAHRQLHGERPGQTLRTTALVNEAYVRMVGMGVEWQGRSHFFALAARAMRRILVDAARRRRAHKRGGGAGRVPFEEIENGLAVSIDADLVDLDLALGDLERLDPRKSRAVELRFFAGLPAHAIAEHLGVSATTVDRDLRMALAWLHRHLDRTGHREAPPERAVENGKPREPSARGQGQS